MPPAQHAITNAPPPPSILSTGFNKLLKKVKVVAHYGFVPLVLYLGFQADENAHFLQLFAPF
jgi:hypothetical protein